MKNSQQKTVMPKHIRQALLDFAWDADMSISEVVIRSVCCYMAAIQLEKHPWDRLPIFLTKDMQEEIEGWPIERQGW